MKFEIVNNEQGHMSLKGYRLIVDETAETFWDKEVEKTLVNQRGANYVDALFDDIYDGFEPICKGSDGKLYTVLFVYLDNNYIPFIWQEVEKC